MSSIHCNLYHFADVSTHEQLGRFYPPSTLSSQMGQETGVIYGMAGWAPSSSDMPRANAQRLRKLVVIPRIDVASLLGAPIPFMRAYSPDLRAHGVHEKEFLEFVDGLAVAQAPPVVLDALNVAGDVLGFVPEPICAMTGTGLNVAAGVGSYATSVIRTRALMSKINEEYFAPRGLKASICKNEELGRKLGIDLSKPLAALGINCDQVRAGQRQLQAIGSLIAPLTFDVPPPSPQRNFLDQKAVEKLQREDKKRRKKDDKKKAKRDAGEAMQSNSKTSNIGVRQSDYSDYKYDSDTSSSSDSCRRPSASKERKQREKFEKKQRKREKEEAKANKKVAEKEQKDRGKLEKKSAKIDEKIEKMEYIVIEML